MKISKPIGSSTSNEKKNKKGVIADPLQVMNIKGVDFLSYFLNSEFKSK